MKKRKVANRKSHKSAKTRVAAAIEPAVVVGTTAERKPRLVVKKPATLAEALAEPIVDVAKEKTISVRKVARGKRAA